MAQQSTRVTEYFRGLSGRSNYDRLVIFAQKKIMGIKFFHPSKAAQPPTHYVNEAIKRCLPSPTGEIARDLDRDLPLEVMFKGIIESVISHELFPAEVRKKTKGEFAYVEAGEGVRQQTADDFEESVWSGEPDRDSGIRANAIRNLDDRPIIEAFLKFISKDDIVYRIIRLLLEEDIDEPAELVASRIGITVKEVNNARKRRDRLCLQFAQEGNCK